MNVLFGKCFGLGNAVMAVPAIKALHSMGHKVHVLIGSTRDDVGAMDVLLALKTHYGCIERIWVDSAPYGAAPVFDLAIMSIPFDGRWREGMHFHAKQVVDGRTRPDPTTTGLVSWKKHEIEYQMDNIYTLGYQGDVPSCAFLPPEEWALRPRVFYLGLGYKKDAAGFWKVKHWGNENYAELVKLVLAEHPMNLVYTSGDTGDLQLSIRPIMAAVDDKRFMHDPANLKESIRLVNRCGMYVGNDTGMMHVSAACNRQVVGIFKMQNSATKARPWCDTYSCVEAFDLQGNPRTISVEEVFREIKEMLG